MYDLLSDMNDIGLFYYLFYLYANIFENIRVEVHK